jgi:hypothetical protein
MAAAILANKNQLCRVIVPKPLLNQTAETLQSRLGGLAGREIRHLHFSRQVSTKNGLTDQYKRNHQEILHKGGIIITTPEVALSYKLSGEQSLFDNQRAAATKMRDCQAWFDRVARDIIDESDLTLAVKTQLVYPSGTLLSLDGSPYRWTIPQLLIALVEEHLPTLLQEHPKEIEVVDRKDGFPFVLLLHTDIEKELCELLINDICNGRWDLFQKILYPSGDIATNNSGLVAHHAQVMADLKTLLSYKAFDSIMFAKILDLAKEDKSAISDSILIMRGLLAYGVFISCLKKRWGIQYGPFLERQPMAVPYEAKGKPSERAEFGYPDVAITLTCLSFLYSGLNGGQLCEALRLILASDDPASKYSNWVETVHSLPTSLQSWDLIDMDDEIQMRELWGYLRFNRNVIWHYLNNIVFPVHAKQFPSKIQASAWDLPLFSGETGNVRTTGFSGTSDNKTLLPLTISQESLPSLQQTNAEVLTYLLQDRNRQYISAVQQSGKRLTEQELLRYLNELGIRLLIDSGAYILEMNNEDVASAWLKIDSTAQAAVYFDGRDRAWVRYRGRKRPVLLLATPLINNLKDCFVYLDQAHTRGVDLKFPTDAKGTVTLALGQTKDHTIQGQFAYRYFLWLTNKGS